jgi:hypothetical protein
MAVFFLWIKLIKCSLVVHLKKTTPLKCIDSYRNFDVFFIISQASSIPETNEYHRKSTPYYLLLWVIKDQSSLMLLLWLPSK